MRRAFRLIPCVLLAAGLSTACGSNPTAPATTNTAAAFVGSWQNVDPGTRSLPQMTISNGQLHSVLHTHFVDGSGRPDYDSVDVFNKVS